MEVQNIIEEIKNWLLTSGLRILLIIFLGLIVHRLLRLVSNRSIKFVKDDKREDEMKKRADTINSLIKTIIGISIILIAATMILGEFGVEIGPILAAAGVLGIAIGFGSQRLVEDIISGFFILLENQLRVGDYVQTAGKSGIVEKVSLKLTVLRDIDGNVHFIRNGKIDIVTNMTKDYSRYLFEIGVAYREDVDEVMQVMKQVDEDLRKDASFASLILEPIDIMGLDQFADSALIIKARIKTKPLKQWKVAREFNRRLKKRFDDLGIEIPFPHMTMYMGQNKKGKYTTLNLSHLNNAENDMNGI
ncbi:MAG: mechanosensitive ion channel family protein [Candidatus Zixiibacteriota bacterium]